MTGARTPAAGVSYLRRLTLTRSTRSYVEWIGRSVGWWTIMYLLFWLGAFAVAGVQLLGVLTEPLPIPVLGVSVTIATVAFALITYRAKVPPVILARRDLYRLALSPAAPFMSLRWSFQFRWGSLGVLGVLLGSVWAVVSPYWFHQQAYLAGPALALILISYVNVLWLRYTTRDNPGADLRNVWAAPAAAALALVGLVVPDFGLTAAFSSSSPFVLLSPLLLAALSALLVHRSLLRTFPARFPPQCFVLAELQAMRTMNLLSAMMGMGSGNEDAAYRARLLATLHDRPGATRPTRSLRLPRPGMPVWRALAWRTWLMLYRRPFGPQLRTAFFLLLSAASLLLAPAVGPFGLFIGALLTGNLASQLLGAGAYTPVLPLDPVARTRGRAAPGALLLLLTVILVGLGLTSFGVQLPADSLPFAVSLALLVLLLLEKLSAWTRTSHLRLETWGMAALLASSPALLLGAFGLDPLIVTVQLGLVVIFSVLPG